MTHEQVIYTACGVAAWWIVPHFVKPFSEWPGTMYMQAIGTAAFFIYLTSTLPEDSPNYTPFSEWVSLIGIGIVIYGIYQFANDKKGP